MPVTSTNSNHGRTRSGGLRVARLPIRLRLGKNDRSKRSRFHLDPPLLFEEATRKHIRDQVLQELQASLRGDGALHQPLAQGIYRNNIAFDLFTVNHFTFTLYEPRLYSSVGCGACALSLLTGQSPLSIKLPKSKQGDADDRFMVRYLKRRHFVVLPVTQSDVTQFPRYIVNQIGDRHVVLISQMMVRGAASWAVLHGGLIYHNFDVTMLKPLELLNHPLLSAYVIYKVDWK
jgi:hypothetical protein